MGAQRGLPISQEHPRDPTPGDTAYNRGRLITPEAVRSLVPEMSAQVLLIMLLPPFAVIAAGLLGATQSLSKLWRSAVQHFAAGVVFAAISTEIIPEVMHADTPVAALIGFAAGVAAMFAMRWLAERLEARDVSKAALPLGFLAAVAIDCVIDGVVIGTGFAVGARQGVILAVALALEMFFLGLATANTMRESGARVATAVGACIGLAVIIAASAAIGFALLAGAPAVITTTLLAFGSAALLYLVTEELLVRAHDLGRNPAGHLAVLPRILGGLRHRVARVTPRDRRRSARRRPESLQPPSVPTPKHTHTHGHQEMR